MKFETISKHKNMATSEDQSFDLYKRTNAYYKSDCEAVKFPDKVSLIAN